MSDTALPSAFDPARKPDAKDVWTFQRAEARRSKRLLLVSAGANAIQFALNAGLAVALIMALPLVRVVPVMLWAQPDGMVGNAVLTSSLPGSLNDAQKRAWLWQYVTLREGYAFHSSKYNYDVVSAMSAPNVRDAYQDWFQYKNPKSPQAALGRHGTIRLKWLDSELQGNDVFRVRYCRIIEEEGRPPQVQPSVASLSYQETYVVPAAQRVTYNPGAYVVTEYPGAEPIGSSTGPHPECAE